MNLSRPITTLFAAAALTACAPVVQGGPMLPLPPGLQETAQVRSVIVSSGWVRSEGDFVDTFSDEVQEELNACMWGTALIDVRIHVDNLERSGRLDMLLNGGGEQRLSGTVEFVDPNRGNVVVGRFPVAVSARIPGGLTGVVADRQMVVSEALGRGVCEAAFGRNPRRPGPHNATE